MDFDKYFDTLNEFTDADRKEVNDCNECCKNFDNYIMHNGMTTCKECSSVISNVSDSPEWRYYGSNDSKSSDPTRCGMPINPLLVESSYGCKVIGHNSNYEMRKIKRYTSRFKRYN